MAVTAFLFGKLPANLAGGETAGETRIIDWLSNDIRVMLCTSTYVPNQDTHEFKSDVTNEVVGAGYVAGGAVLGSKTLTYDPITNRSIFDAADATWAASTITARYAIIYNNTPAADADKPLIGYLNFGADKSTAGTDFTIEWSADGIFRAIVG